MLGLRLLVQSARIPWRIVGVAEDILPQHVEALGDVFAGQALRDAIEGFGGGAAEHVLGLGSAGEIRGRGGLTRQCRLWKPLRM